MDNSKPKKVTQVALLTICDDFVEFNDYCAFLCDALSAIFSEYAENEIDNHTIQGVKRHCYDLKERSEKLERALNNLYQQSSINPQITKVKSNQ